MIILENEIKKLDDLKDQFTVIKECLWPSKIKWGNTKLKERANGGRFLFGLK